eukprot:748987-Hanusia_phi.AAC.2
MRPPERVVGAELPVGGESPRAVGDGDVEVEVVDQSSAAGRGGRKMSLLVLHEQLKGPVQGEHVAQDGPAEATGRVGRRVHLVPPALVRVEPRGRHAARKEKRLDQSP